MSHRTVIDSRCILGLLLIAALFLPGRVRAQSRHCYECHKDKEQEFKQPVVHDPVARKDCESCHKRHGFSQKLVLKANGPGLCTGCHADFQKKNPGDVVHQAVKEGLCWTCHEPHATKRKGLIREVEGRTACFVCHDEMLAPGRQASVHKPFADEQCERCHESHAGGQKGLIRKPVDELCAGCHDTGQPSFTAKHPPSTRDLACTVCHDPHNSETAPLIASGLHPVMADGDCSACHESNAPGSGDLVSSPPDLCLTCHDQVQAEAGRTHPHSPAAEGECLHCHVPHASRAGNLLVSSQFDLCRQCHDVELDDNRPVGHEPYLRGECGECHEPHGSDNASLLARTDNGLCTSCHSQPDYTSPQHAAAADDCRTCHSSHTSGRGGLLTEEPQTLCVACHEVDRSIPVLHEPYAQGTCAMCHSSHASTESHLVRTTQDRLCTPCHVDIQRFLMAPEKHEPASDCGHCHAPHGGERENLLTQSPAQLCETCHETEQPPAGGNVHVPYAQGDCAGCHNPHGAFNPDLIGPRLQEVQTEAGLVLKYPAIDSTRASLCRLCHRQDMNAWDSLAVVHVPVKEGRCDVCHSPHTGSAGLLSGSVDRLCAGCHETSGPTMARKHRGVSLAGADCADCHNPHASDLPGLISPQEHPPFAEGNCGACHLEQDGSVVRDLAESPPVLCANCHENYAQAGPRVTVHAPVATGECGECHKNHASVEAHLLRDSGADLCKRCHQVDLNQSVVHRPVGDGECLACHPAHRAEGGRLTVRSGSALCLGCHEDLSERLKTEQVHAPVPDNCSTCHAPHSGPRDALLVNDMGALCQGCHDRDAAWKGKHMGGEMSGGCTSCHDPHAAPAGQKALLYKYQHEPFASGDCNACHTGPGTAPESVCGDCHGEYTEAAGAAKFPHPPVSGGKCLACHRAHAAPVPALLPGSGSRTCGGCHERVTGADISKHPPMESCQNCHAPHGNDTPHMLTSGEEMALCEGCHADTRGRHFHPMGGEVIDPNTEAPLVCSGCHNPHGSEQPSLLKADPRRGLCVLCHETSH